MSEPEPPRIKEEEEELNISQEVKEENDTFMVTLASAESDHSESEPISARLLSHSSPETESRDQEGTKNVDSITSTEPRRKTEDCRNKGHRNTAGNCSTGKKPVKCAFCEKVFKHKSQMERHHRIHTGERPYSCATCGKGFSQSSNLTVHMRTHTGEKPFSCETCGKHFTCSYSLLVHMRIHTGAKPYSCKACGKNFNSSFNLKVHVNTHVGERPYSCKLCGKTFSQPSNLNVHMRTHTGEKPCLCNTCGKRFTDLSALKNHMVVHTGEKLTLNRWTHLICKGCPSCIHVAGESTGELLNTRAERWGLLFVQRSPVGPSLFLCFTNGSRSESAAGRPPGRCR
uniref:C2H2-type domain-containing protein n=1 Tax=Amphilophus citrinellus TaxID=61819 RepID=A0A3Q0T757_AMPCI